MLRGTRQRSHWSRFCCKPLMVIAKRLPRCTINCISPSAPPSPTRSWRMQDQRALAPTFVSRLAEQGTSVRIFSFRHHAIRAGLATTTVLCGPLQPVATVSQSLVHATNGREACQTGALVACQIGVRTIYGGVAHSGTPLQQVSRRVQTVALRTT